jgi:hypothetical protein
MRRIIIGSLALVLAAGCRTVPSPSIRLQGDPTSITRLAGSWVGDYRGGAGGRGGSLDFSLRAGSDSLYGDVTMIALHGRPLRHADPMDVHRAHVQSPQTLRVDFVSVQADSVRGMLEPYISPDCECSVSTTFYGQVLGNQITGRFETRSGGIVRAEGFWQLKRVADAPR